MEIESCYTSRDFIRETSIFPIIPLYGGETLKYYSSCLSYTRRFGQYSVCEILSTPNYTFYSENRLQSLLVPSEEPTQTLRP